MRTLKPRTIALVAALFAACSNQGAPVTADGTPAIPASPGVTNQRQDQRWLARQGQARQAVGSGLRFAGVNQATAQYSALAGALTPLAAATMSPIGPVDYFASPNWANSPLAQVDANGVPIAGTGMRKFVDTLPGLCAVSGANNLGQCLPLAKPLKDATGGDLFPGSDTYRIGLSDYTRALHSDLKLWPTKLRGYVDLNGSNPHQYLGPVILAFRDRPVRVRFVNQLGNGAAGDLFIPTDTTYMGAGMGPDGTAYTQNRATLHLHGGNTPWISDGTPHQWTVPAGELTTLKKGVSARDVPDMGTTGDGELTFYWTNQQSGRFMFYHDHAYGITRLNVYAGEAAGFLLVDPAEEGGLRAATVPGWIQSAQVNDLAHVIPLVIQDKSFVPDDGASGGQLAATDPTWNVAKWGGKGQLWFPHIYMPNQNPADVTGSNAFGRWDYGPWFWPPQDPTTFVADGQPYVCDSAAFPSGSPPAFPPLLCPGTPSPRSPISQVSGTPEAFMDTPVVNGTAYPTMAIKPSAYRFQVLSAGNDRTWNLGLYYAATPGGKICKGGVVKDLSTCTEVSMVPAVPHRVCAGPLDNNCICNGGGASPPGCFPNPGGPPLGVCSTASQFGGGGLVTGNIVSAGFDKVTGLPLEKSKPCWPTTWPIDGREGGVPDPTTAGPAIIQIGAEGGLLPSPVVIPSTPVNYEYNRRSITVLNIYNHGLLLGPAERAEVVVDFSGVPTGSALILYNDAPAPVPAFDPRVDYYTNNPDYSPTGGAPSTPAGYGPNIRTVMQFTVPAKSTNDNLVPFSFTALQTALPNIFATTQDRIIVPEKAYPVANGGSTVDSYARIQDADLSVQGSPQPMLRKTIQELFTLDYGRMNATLGVELPLTNFLTQTTIPYGYVDPPTEIIKDGETQYWKVTHNGVDTHFIHFHLFLVQVINRVGWDGMIKPPDANELGWKDTVRMNPLEDIIIAIRPFKQTLPWKLGNSIRPLDVTQPVGVSLTNQFTNVDPTNQPAQVFNDLTNFGWEYVWHCHILGHEENDMMRAVSFVVAPEAPTITAAQGSCISGPCVNLSWTIPTPNTATGFSLDVSVNGAPFTSLTTVDASVGTYVHNGLTLGSSYQYRITADNKVGYTRTYAAPAAGYPVVTSSSAPATSSLVTIQ